MKQIRETWPNDVRIVLHNRPLDFHNRAMPAALGAMAAHQQGKFWAYHDLLFERKKFEDPDLEAMAQDLGLDMDKWRADYASPALETFVRKQDTACVKVGASGTPAFFVNGRSLSGAKPFPEFKTVIEEELEKARAEVAKGIARADIYDHMLGLGRRSPVSGLEPIAFRFNLEGNPAMGPANAAATLVIFSDFECPFCSRIVKPVHEAYEKMGGQLRVVFKQFPLTSIHANARPAALASLAAARQGKFWRMHDLLFANQKRLSRAELSNWAKVAGLDVARFEADMQDPALLRQLQIDNQDAIQANVRGTPTSFLNGRRLLSPPTSADALIELINSEILKL